MSERYDVIVCGLGAMGSAALYQLSKTGRKVLGIDQFSPPHTEGSSHGDTRITRQAIGEGKYYTPLILLANENWNEIEALTGTKLYNRCGGLMFGPGDTATTQHGANNFIEETIRAANEYGIQHEILDHRELSKRFPQFIYHGTEIGYYEPEAGYLIPEKCIDAQLRLAKDIGAEVALNTKILRIEPVESGVIVTTGDDSYHAEKIIVTAGAWVNSFLPEELQQYFKVYRQVLFWFQTAIDIAEFQPGKFPVYIRTDKRDEDMFYGFPSIDGPGKGIKLAAEKFEEPCLPDEMNRNVAAAEVEALYAHVSQFLRIKPDCVRSATCMYTVTPDYDFVIDTLPDSPQIILASPCSGHGFKHSSGVGTLLCEMALGAEPGIDISELRLSRLTTKSL